MAKDNGWEAPSVAASLLPSHIDRVAMKIATFNINNVNRRLPNLLAWLKKAKPDVVCLQELKAEDQASPKLPSAKPATARSGAVRRRGTASPSLPGKRRPC